MAKRDGHASREMVTQVREEVKRREKAIMQRLMAQERELFSDEHPEDKGNGYYERSLLTSSGLIEDLRVRARVPGSSTPPSYRARGGLLWIWVTSSWSCSPAA